jgi:hypothetical protein
MSSTTKILTFLSACILLLVKAQERKCRWWQCEFLRKREMHRAYTTQNMKTKIITISTFVLQFKKENI